MDKKEFAAPNFKPERFLHIICILEGEEKHHSFKIIRNKKTFSLLPNLGPRNRKRRH